MYYREWVIVASTLYKIDAIFPFLELGKMNTVTEKYRWYLCSEQTSLTWSCTSTTADVALNPATVFYGEKPNTKAVPINKYIPKIFDYFILHNSIHPRIKMSI